MPDQAHRRIGPRASSAATSRQARHQLPPDLLKQASRRLGILSLLVAALWIVATVLYHYVDRVIGAGDMRWSSLRPTDAFVAFGAAMSIALYFYSRRSTRDPAVILDLGLAYLIASSFIAGLILHWDTPAGERSVAPAISWLGTFVLCFAATVPNRPVKIFVAGMLAVSMNPIGMLIARSRGHWPFESAWTAWMMHYPDMLLVVMATVIANVVTSLGDQVAKAREMGSYQLRELIGRGGMGEVYRATHRMLARPAAIKLIRPEMIAGGRQQAAARFRREAEAAATLRSPHTVELYDFGMTDDGTLYFAMELLDGLDLETLVRQTGPIPARRVIHILRQVCESLEEAHARGLVHRDIKPANIHLGRLGVREDFAKVLDFGLVTAPAGNDDLASLSTAAGVVPGTPAYMAPETALGVPIDGRADLYALGCVAYFLLTGRLVFEQSGGALQTLVKRLQEDPKPPSSRTELPIPPALDDLVLACLAKRPEDRPRSAAALRQALDAIGVEPWTDACAAEWWTLHPLRRAESDPATRSEEHLTKTAETV